MRGKSIAEIAAFQWCNSNEAIIGALTKLEAGRVLLTNYESLVRNPTATLAKIDAALGLADRAADAPTDELALSRTTVSKPSPGKWKRHAAALEALSPVLLQTQENIEAFCDTLDNGSA